MAVSEIQARLEDELRALRAENERLRAALRTVAQQDRICGNEARADWADAIALAPDDGREEGEG